MTTATAETVVLVDGEPLAIVETVGTAELPALHIQLAPGVRLYGTTKDLVDFAGAIVDAVDVAVAQVAHLSVHGDPQDTEVGSVPLEPVPGRTPQPVNP